MGGSLKVVKKQDWPLKVNPFSRGITRALLKSEEGTRSHGWVFKDV